MIWYVHRVDGAITSAHEWVQPGYAEEALDDAVAADLIAFLEPAEHPVPPKVSAGQLIRALAQLDLLDAVDTAVAGADPLTQRLWARAAFFPRHDPMIEAMAAAVGKTSDELDDVFRLAASI